MPESPKISVIIPTFNQGQFIEQTILSILSQNYDPVEIIIIDGGSKDATPDIIRKYETKIKYWISESDKGQSHAINKGLKLAEGGIVTWLNSDDYYEPGALTAVANEFSENPDIDIIHGKSRLFGEKMKDKIIGPDFDLTISEYLSYMRFPQPSSFYRRKYLNADQPVDNDLHYAMDFDLLVRSLLTGAKIKRTNALLSHYRIHPDSKSKHELKFAAEWTLVVFSVLNSLHAGKFFAEKLKSLGLVSGHVKKRFEQTTDLSGAQAEAIFLEHLHLLYHSYYRHFNDALCKIISDHLAQNHNSFYIKNNYKRYNFRLKFIPGFIFKLVRKF